MSTARSSPASSTASTPDPRPRTRRPSPISLRRSPSLAHPHRAEYDVVGGYVPSLIQHLKETTTRLGLDAASDSTDEPDPVGTPHDHHHADLDPSAFAFSNWTPAEHDAFFRALSVHSRWRPDLIAASVPTRSEWEVGMYLEALEEGAATLAGEDEDDVEMETEMGSIASGSGSGSGSDADANEDEYQCACEPAYEVSQEWVDAEDIMASCIIREETLASATIPSSDTDKDDTSHQGRGRTENENEGAGEVTKRKRGRPRTSEKGRPRGRSHVKKTLKEASPSPSPSTQMVDHTSHKHARDPSAFSPRKRRKTELERDALMGRLDPSHLLVLESILREDEQEKSRSREGSVMETRTSGPSIHATIAPSLPDDRTVLRDASSARSLPDDTSNTMIDPVLLALSAVPNEVTSRRPDADTASIPLPTSTLPPTNTTNTSTLLRNTMTRNSEPPELFKTAELDLSFFSPCGRRRLQKRLYMRRRRALLRAHSGSSESVLLDTSLEKRKPGRKAKSEQGEMSRTGLGMSISLPCSGEDVGNADANEDEDEDEDEDGDGNANANAKQVAYKTRGLTLPYKLRAEFLKLGVDGVYLRTWGMDLLNVGALGKLIGLFTSLAQGRRSGEGEEGEGEGEDDTPLTEYIDARLIQQLQATLVSFVTDVLHKAIVWKEGEKKLKHRSRAWRYGDQITISAIEHAVRAVGARYQSHKQFFAALALEGLSKGSDDARAGAGARAQADRRGRENASASTSGEVDAGLGLSIPDASPPVFSLHRDMYTPHVRPPPFLQPLTLEHLSQTYEKEAGKWGMQRRLIADEEDELMEEETDEEALEGELEEEDMIERADMKRSLEYERGLWDAVRVT